MSMLQTWQHRPPMHCDCGCDPCQCGDCGPSWSQSAIDCYNQMSQFREMLAQILQDPKLRIPLIGITDGSNAKPGEVGEYIKGAATVHYAAYPTVTVQTVSVLVVPPGDWNLWGYMTLSTGVGGANFATTTPPAGMDDWITALAIESAVAGSVDYIFLPSNTVRGLFTVPSLIATQVTVWQTTNATLPAGVATVKIMGRRMR